MTTDSTSRVARTAADTNSHNTLVVALEPVLIDDPLLGPLADQSVTVRYEDGSEERLTSDGDGVIEVFRDRGRYTDLEWETKLATYRDRVFVILDPLTTPAGAWQRLVNLGYVEEAEPPAEPPEPEDLEGALAEFQAEHGLEPTAELDDETQGVLEESTESWTAWNERNLGDADWLDREARDYPLDILT